MPSLIFRITGLLRSEALKPENKPIWYEVYQKFPPKYPPRFDRPVPNMDVQQIFYPEDALRAKIKKTKSALLGTVNLSDNNRLSNVQKCIAYYEELRQGGEAEDLALDKAVERVISELPIRRQERPAPTTPSLVEEFKRSKTLVKDIFKE